MKILIVFYSRTNTTEKAALELQKLIGADCDLERIIDLKSRKGAMGYIFAGHDAMKKKLTEIRLEKISGSTASEEIEPLDNYDIIIIGSPVWAFTMPPAIRTYLGQLKEKSPLPPRQNDSVGLAFKKGEYKIAFFTTQGSSKRFEIFDEMAELIGQKPIAEMHLTTKEVVQNQDKENLFKFAKEINKEIEQ